MKFYELSTISLTFAGLQAAPEAVVRFTTSSEAQGRLLGCWTTEFGRLNRVLVLRDFDTAEELMDERVRTQTHEDPFYISEALTDLAMDSYAPFPGFDEPAIGAFGPLYEIRTYSVKPGGLAPTLRDWSLAAAERNRASRLWIVMYSLAGPMRITHIWPYSDLNQRGAARAKAAATGNWPPRSGGKWIVPISMESGLFLPVPKSPLR